MLAGTRLCARARSSSRTARARPSAPPPLSTMFTACSHDGCALPLHFTRYSQPPNDAGARLAAFTLVYSHASSPAAAPARRTPRVPHAVRPCGAPAPVAAVAALALHARHCAPHVSSKCARTLRYAALLAVVSPIRPFNVSHATISPVAASSISPHCAMPASATARSYAHATVAPTVRSSSASHLDGRLRANASVTSGDRCVTSISARRAF
mmetsp:Transcript_60497/g.159993  ORF Transcript_60497/g.159993 Transcript_60497/m.159993 type:complete len:211 (+) Transcript_60497:250-882(+)